MDIYKYHLVIESPWIKLIFCSAITVLISIRIWSTKKESTNQDSHHFPSKVVPKIPGAYPIIGHGLQIAKDLLGFLRRCTKSHGNIFRIKMFKWNAVIIGDYEVWKAVILAPEEHLSTRAFAGTLPLKTAILGDSNIYTERLNRTPVKKSLSFKSNFIPIVNAEAEAMLESIKFKYFNASNFIAIFDLRTEVQEFFVNSLTRASFGFELGESGFKAAVALKTWLNTIMPFAPLIPEQLLKGITKIFTRKTRDRLVTVLQEKIACYRSDRSTNRTEFMQGCVDFKDKETGDSLSDDDLCSVMASILHTSLETATLFTNLIAELILNPLWLQKAQKECQSYIESRNFQGLLESSLIDALIWESTRTNAGGISVVKAVQVKNVNVCGHNIGDADIVALSGPLVMEAAGYTDLSKFDPTRFYSSKGKELTRILSSLIFSAGPSYCPGKELVLLQIKTALAQILTKTKFNLEQTIVSKTTPGANAILSRNVTAAVQFI